MYIVVKKTNNTIVASSTARITDREGYTVYEIDDAEYKPELVGSILHSFDVISSSDDQT